jgi:hypothetical protein
MAWGKTYDRKLPERRELTAVQQRIIPDARTVVQEVTGNYYRPGGTDVALADGGTGASTAQAANANLFSRYLVAASGAAQSVGATTNETVLATIAIPANSLGSNGFIEVEAVWTVTNNGNAKTPRVRFGASGAGTGGTAIRQPSAASVVIYHEFVIIQNRNATNSQVGSTGTAVVGPYGTGGAALPTAAIDTTAAAEVVISGQKGDSADTMTLEAYRVWLTKN